MDISQILKSICIFTPKGYRYISDIGNIHMIKMNTSELNFSHRNIFLQECEYESIIDSHAKTIVIESLINSHTNNIHGKCKADYLNHCSRGADNQKYPIKESVWCQMGFLGLGT